MSSFSACSLLLYRNATAFVLYYFAEFFSFLKFFVLFSMHKSDNSKSLHFLR